jgi:hypothetical protein
MYYMHTEATDVPRIFKNIPLLTYIKHPHTHTDMVLKLMFMYWYFKPGKWQGKDKNATFIKWNTVHSRVHIICQLLVWGWTGKLLKEGSTAYTPPGTSDVHINRSNFQSLLYMTAFALCYYTAAKADVHSWNTTTYTPKQCICFWNRYNAACCSDVGLATAILYKLQTMLSVGESSYWPTWAPTINLLYLSLTL